MTIGFIDDGYGALIADGDGGFIGDGTVPAVAFTRGQQRLYAATLRTAYQGAQRRRVLWLPVTVPACLTPTYIEDGFGVDIEDGYGSFILDGYCGLPPVQARPFNRFPQRRWVPEPAYAGRRRHAILNASTRPDLPPSLPYGFQRRLLAEVRNHFAPPAYAGRRQLRPTFSYDGGIGLPPRASQLVVENLAYSAAPSVRVTSQTVETIANLNTGVRAGQLVSETLLQQAEGAYARASQLVCEILVPNIEVPLTLVYPELVGLKFEVLKRPKFSTGVGVAASGREIAVAYWSRPQWEWDLSYDMLRDNGKYAGSTQSDIKTLMGFLLGQFGSWGRFYFRDPDDCTVTGGALGVSDGSRTPMLFSRTYGLGDYVGNEPVGTVRLDEPLNIYANGVLADPSTYVVNTTAPCGNTLVFNTAQAAGTVITADFGFYYFCRLKDDTYDFSKFMQNLWSAEKLTIFSLKN